MTASILNVLAVLATDTFAVGITLGFVTVADDSVTGSTTATEVVGVHEALVADGGVVAASTVVERVEFDSVLAAVEAGSAVSDAAVSGADPAVGVLSCEDSDVAPEAAVAVDFGCASTSVVSFGDSSLVGLEAAEASESVVLVCAPPLLLIVTPGATSVDDDVAPDEVVDAPADDVA